MWEVSSTGTKPVQVNVNTEKGQPAWASGLKWYLLSHLGARRVQGFHRHHCAPAGLLQHVQNAVMGGAVAMSDAQQLRTRVSAALISCLVCHALTGSLQVA